MRYYATASTERVRDAMRADLLGQIITPAAGNRLEPHIEWVADNGIYSRAYPGDGAYLSWLASHATYRSRCRFAVAPDVVADHGATLERCPRCYAELAEWKVGDTAAAVTAEAKRRGKWVHMGRVNSQDRLERARTMGVDSADGTYLAYGPDINLVRLLGWLYPGDFRFIRAEQAQAKHVAVRADGSQLDLFSTTTEEAAA